MNLLVILLIIFALLMLVGNPHVGTRIYPGYNYGYFPGGVGLIVVIILIVLLLR